MVLSSHRMSILQNVSAQGRLEIKVQSELALHVFGGDVGMGTHPHIVVSHLYPAP
jgi:hypothetical protein